MTLNRIVQSINKHWFKLWLFALVAVVIGSLSPAIAPPDSFDTLSHFGFYCLLAAVPMARIENRERAFLATAFVPILGMLLEYGQRSVAGRSFSAGDMLANDFGAICGILIGIVLRLKRHGMRQKGA